MGAVSRALSNLSLCFLLHTGLSAQDQAPVQDKALSFKIAQGFGPNGELTYYEDEPRTVVYFRNGAYDPESLAIVNELLKDRDSGELAPNGIDPKLPDALYNLKTELEAKYPGLKVVFHMISGYRSWKTNEDLRNDQNNPYRKSVAQNSSHPPAQAADFFVPGVKSEILRDTARCTKGIGGVGWYPQFNSDELQYIHVDVRDQPHSWGFKPKSCPVEPR